MTSTTPGTIAVIGGPNSGKSTWLGAVIDAINGGQTNVLGIPSDGWPADASAIDILTERLADGHYPERTSKSSDLALELELGLRACHPAWGEKDFQLRVSDYAGEQLDRLFEDRIRGWSQAWRARASASGFLLFIRPDASLALPRTVSLSDASPWDQILSDSDPSPPAADQNTKLGPISPDDHFPPIDDEVPEVDALAPREPVKIPSVLSLIEMLQFLRAERGYGIGHRPARGTMRVAVVVSAWDAVGTKWRTKGPNHYLVEQMPLLTQFLSSNFHDDDVFRFGLSATGGNLEDPEYRKSYQDEPRGWNEWRAPDGTITKTTEIGLPLLWTLFGDEVLSLGS